MGTHPLTEPALTGSEGEPPPPTGAILDRKQLEFLATKVVPPRCEGLIPRPRLLDIVSQLSGKRLAMIKAPAGFGKTSLAAAWSLELQQSGNAVGWLTIDSDDDEPATFIFYLCHAL
jgi:LuxR family transcriptional regulator, maltose regulon positive regulatory protein